MDLLSSKTGQNRTEHHTDLYHGDELIIRRGQTFQIEVELNRPFEANADKLHMELRTGTERLLAGFRRCSHILKYYSLSIIFI